MKIKGIKTSDCQVGSNPKWHLQQLLGTADHDNNVWIVFPSCNQCRDIFALVVAKMMFIEGRCVLVLYVTQDYHPLSIPFEASLYILFCWNDNEIESTLYSNFNCIRKHRRGIHALLAYFFNNILKFLKQIILTPVWIANMLININNIP